MKKKNTDLEIQEETMENGNIVGRCIVPSGEIFEFRLNNRGTGYYAMTGTMSMVDPATRRTLKIYNDETETMKLASIQLHVAPAKAGEDAQRLVKKEVERGAYKLLKEYKKQHAQRTREGDDKCCMA